MCTRRVLHPLKWGHLGGKAFVGSASALPALLPLGDPPPPPDLIPK